VKRKRWPEVRLHLLCTDFGRHRPRFLGSYVRAIVPGRPDLGSVMATARTRTVPVTTPAGEMFTKVCKSCGKHRQWLASDVEQIMAALDAPKLYRFDWTTKSLL
jgi:hypothetical protein